MRRKKTVIPAVPVEGVIDLEAEVPPTGKPQTQYEAGIAELNADNPSKPEVSPKPKRKYTRRATKKVETGIAVAPTFIDKDGIRSARVQAFIDYVDGKRTFDSAAQYDTRLIQLLAVADQLTLNGLEQAHARATENINQLTSVEEGGYYRDDTKNRTRSDV